MEGVNPSDITTVPLFDDSAYVYEDACLRRRSFHPRLYIHHCHYQFLRSEVVENNGALNDELIDADFQFAL